VIHFQISKHRIIVMKISPTAAALLASLAAHTATAGFVTTSGTTFHVDGNPFYMFGTNAYWASETTWVSRAVPVLERYP
jgi:hypothetical protein